METRYKNFLLEGDSEWEERYISMGVHRSPRVEQRIKRFQEFIDRVNPEKKSKGTNTNDSDDEDYEDEDDNGANSNYQGDAKTFSDTDKMIEIVVGYLKKHGITNPYIQRAILATIGKESGFTATKETSYRTSSPEIIRKSFGSRVADLSDDQLNVLKKDDYKFWEKVYGGEWGKKYLGNTQPGDGAKYIGRGFNGITGRATYTTYAKDLKDKGGVNADIVASPEILEKDPNISAEANALYFVRGLSDPIIQRKYGNKDPNDFKDFTTALKAAVNANAGSGVDITQGFAKEGYDRALTANSVLKAKFDKAVPGSVASRTA